MLRPDEKDAGYTLRSSTFALHNKVSDKDGFSAMIVSNMKWMKKSKVQSKAESDGSYE